MSVHEIIFSSFCGFLTHKIATRRKIKGRRKWTG